MYERASGTRRKRLVMRKSGEKLKWISHWCHCINPRRSNISGRNPNFDSISNCRIGRCRIRPFHRNLKNEGSLMIEVGKRKSYHQGMNSFLWDRVFR